MADNNAETELQSEEKLSKTESIKSEATAVIDEKKVQTAVKFLQNPKVRKTSFEKRISFLRNKGLTEDEINLALKKSGTEQDKKTPYQDDTTMAVSMDNQGGEVPAREVAQAQHSTSGSFLGYLASVIVGGSIVYSAGYIIQNYILPYLYGKEQNDTKRLEQSIKELSQGVNVLSSEMQNTLKMLENQFKEQQNLLKTVNEELVVTKAKVDLVPSDVTSLSDVKSEIASVKGLLLGRRQFPPSPFIAPSSSPSIPAWQKAVQKKSEEKTAEQTNYSEKEENTDASQTDKNTETEESQEINNGSFISDQDTNADTPVETKSDESLVFSESFDQGVEGVINNSNSLSSTYVKLDDDS